MTPSLFRAFRDIAYQQAGIRLRDGKEALVSARLGRRLRDLGFTSEGQYLEFLRADASGSEMVEFLDSISTNFTSFYREPVHFEILAGEARTALTLGAGRFRVWCAAASSGEEPYTIALTLASVFEGAAADYRILATDISTRALERARDGRYAQRQIEPVPRWLRTRYFRRAGALAGEDTTYQVVPELRAKISFNRLNLAMPPFPMRGPFDVVMCRNVMIYFDHEVRQRLLSEVGRLLGPQGLLMVGHSETLNGLTAPFRPLRPSVYRRTEDPAKDSR